MSRVAKVNRQTKETDISLRLTIDGSGKYKIDTPIPFFTHMLEAFAKHGLFDIELRAAGDIDVDYHHTIEDVGLVLGEAFRQAVGNKKGMRRYGHFTLPMDETLCTVAVDFCDRPAVVYQTPMRKGRIGNDFDIELVPEFFNGFANAARINLHVLTHYGKNKHHMVEASFKAFARAIDMATSLDPRIKGVLPSTKGKL